MIPVVEKVPKASANANNGNRKRSNVITLASIVTIVLLVMMVFGQPDLGGSSSATTSAVLPNTLQSAGGPSSSTQRSAEIPHRDSEVSSASSSAAAASSFGTGTSYAQTRQQLEQLKQVLLQVQGDLEAKTFALSSAEKKVIEQQSELSRIAAERLKLAAFSSSGVGDASSSRNSNQKSLFAKNTINDVGAPALGTSSSTSVVDKVPIPLGVGQAIATPRTQDTTAFAAEVAVLEALLNAETAASDKAQSLKKKLLEEAQLEANNAPRNADGSAATPAPLLNEPKPEPILLPQEVQRLIEKTNATLNDRLNSDCALSTVRKWGTPSKAADASLPVSASNPFTNPFCYQLPPSIYENWGIGSPFPKTSYCKSANNPLRLHLRLASEAHLRQQLRELQTAVSWGGKLHTRSVELTLSFVEGVTTNPSLSIVSDNKKGAKAKDLSADLSIFSPTDKLAIRRHTVVARLVHLPTENFNPSTAPVEWLSVLPTVVSLGSTSSSSSSSSSTQILPYHFDYAIPLGSLFTADNIDAVCYYSTVLYDESEATAVYPYAKGGATDTASQAGNKASDDNAPPSLISAAADGTTTTTKIPAGFTLPQKSLLTTANKYPAQYLKLGFIVDVPPLRELLVDYEDLTTVMGLSPDGTTTATSNADLLHASAQKHSRLEGRKRGLYAADTPNRHLHLLVSSGSGDDELLSATGGGVECVSNTRATSPLAPDDKSVKTSSSSSKKLDTKATTTPPLALTTISAPQPLTNAHRLDHRHFTRGGHMVVKGRSWMARASDLIGGAPLAAGPPSAPSSSSSTPPLCSPNPSFAFNPNTAVLVPMWNGVHPSMVLKRAPLNMTVMDAVVASSSPPPPPTPAVVGAPATSPSSSSSTMSVLHSIRYESLPRRQIDPKTVFPLREPMKKGCGLAHQRAQEWMFDGKRAEREEVETKEYESAEGPQSILQPDGSRHSRNDAFLDAKHRNHNFNADRLRTNTVDEDIVRVSHHLAMYIDPTSSDDNQRNNLFGHARNINASARVTRFSDVYVVSNAPADMVVSKLKRAVSKRSDKLFGQNGKFLDSFPGDDDSLGEMVIVTFHRRTPKGAENGWWILTGYAQLLPLAQRRFYDHIRYSEEDVIFTRENFDFYCAYKDVTRANGNRFINFLRWEANDTVASPFRHGKTDEEFVAGGEASIYHTNLPKKIQMSEVTIGKDENQLKGVFGILTTRETDQDDAVNKNKKYLRQRIVRSCHAPAAPNSFDNEGRVDHGRFGDLRWHLHQFPPKLHDFIRLPLYDLTTTPTTTSTATTSSTSPPTTEMQATTNTAMEDAVTTDAALTAIDNTTSSATANKTTTDAPTTTTLPTMRRATVEFSKPFRSPFHNNSYSYECQMFGYADFPFWQKESIYMGAWIVPDDTLDTIVDGPSRAVKDLCLGGEEKARERNERGAPSNPWDMEFHNLYREINAFFEAPPVNAYRGSVVPIDWEFINTTKGSGVKYFLHPAAAMQHMRGQKPKHAMEPTFMVEADEKKWHDTQYGEWTDRMRVAKW